MNNKIVKKIKKRARGVVKGVLSTDKYILFLVLFWMLGGFFIFVSASLGLLARDGLVLHKVLSKQFIYLFLAFVLLIFVSQINFKTWLRYSPLLFFASLFLTLLVFVPNISFSSGGASRWLNFGLFSIQPAEFLKAFSSVFALRLWLSFKKYTFQKELFFIFLFFITFTSLVVLAQPDTSNTILIVFLFLSVYFLSGAPIKYIATFILIMLLAAVALFSYRPYVKERLLVFLNPDKDPLGSGYQINQSLIAVGSGHVLGKGFGQGVQKYGYLPEPVGDSIFATYAEEFGFAGSVLLIFLLLLFMLRVLKLAKESKNKAASIAIFSIGSLVVIQAIMNMAAMIGVFPLTGVTFPFISLGGSSLMASAVLIGFLLSAINYSKKAR